MLVQFKLRRTKGYYTTLFSMDVFDIKGVLFVETTHKGTPYDYNYYYEHPEDESVVGISYTSTPMFGVIIKTSVPDFESFSLGLTADENAALLMYQDLCKLMKYEEYDEEDLVTAYSSFLCIDE